MNIFEYVKKIKKSISKNNVLDDINVTREEMTNTTMDFLNKNIGWLTKNERDLQSQAYRRDRDDLIRDFGRTGYLRPTNPFDMVQRSLTNSLEILNWVEGYFTKNLNDDVTAASITIAKSNALQLLDLTALTARYTRAWLELIISAESNALNKLNSEVSLTQQQIKYLGENRDAFGRAIAILATPIKEIQKVFDAMPEIVIAESNPKAVQATQGDVRVDPLRLALVQSKWDPAYLFGMLFTDFQVHRYKMAKEEKEMLELRILRLQRQMEGKEDPKLSDILNKRQGQLDKVRGKIKKMEDEWA